jgi:antitoxin component YwqK of YwqJK toxin-antitoxin module
MRNVSEFSRKLLIVAAALLFSMVTMRAQLNQTDASGHKQGPWIYDGAMTKDPAYAAYAKVEEGDYLHGQKTGLWKRFWPSGQVRSEITYIQDAPMGPYKLYYATGQLEEEGHWQQGKHIRQMRRFYTNGKLKEELVYDEEGTKQGVQRFYHENGKLALEVPMDRGAEHGIQRRFDAEGALLEERHFENGKTKAGGVKSYMTNEQTKASNMAGQMPGKDHQTNAAQPFDPNGYNVFYNQAGQVTMSGDFINGQLYNGRIQHYNENGLATGTEIFTRGRSSGRTVKNANDQ